MYSVVISEFLHPVTTHDGITERSLSQEVGRMVELGTFAYLPGERKVHASLLGSKAAVTSFELDFANILIIAELYGGYIFRPNPVLKGLHCGLIQILND